MKKLTNIEIAERVLAVAERLNEATKAEKEHIASLSGKARAAAIAALKAKATEKSSKPKASKKTQPVNVEKPNEDKPLDKLLKSKVNAGQLRAAMRENPKHAESLVNHLINTPDDHEKFNKNPAVFVNHIKKLSTQKTKERNPRTTPSLGGGKFGNMQDK